MKITFLGTGTSTGVPVLACNCDVCHSEDPKDKRFRTSALITYQGKNIVIDCGPDFRIQMLRHKVENIDAILFTHAHRDHIAGLDDIRAFNFILNKSIDVFGSNDTLQRIKEQFPYIFTPGTYLGAPQLNLFPVGLTPFLAGGLEFTPIEVLHEKMKVLGFRIKDFTYITDANFISPAELEKIKGTKILVINALRNSRHNSHFSLSEAIGIIRQVNPQQAYLTHISHFMGIYKQVEEKLPKTIHLAYDGLELIV